MSGPLACLEVALSLALRYEAMEDFQDIFEFLSEQRYPEGLTKEKKRNFRSVPIICSLRGA